EALASRASRGARDPGLLPTLRRDLQGFARRVAIDIREVIYLPRNPPGFRYETSPIGSAGFALAAVFLRRVGAGLAFPASSAGLAPRAAHLWNRQPSGEADRGGSGHPLSPRRHFPVPLPNASRPADR